MKKFIAAGVAGLLGLATAGSSVAGSFEESMGKCLVRHANTKDSAMVMLECTAGGGKLAGCKVLEDSSGGKGFDKAALCVAEALPMGAKTGLVKVPVRFPGS